MGLRQGAFRLPFTALGDDSPGLLQVVTPHLGQRSARVHDTDITSSGARNMLLLARQVVWSPTVSVCFLTTVWHVHHTGPRWAQASSQSVVSVSPFICLFQTSLVFK